MASYEDQAGVFAVPAPGTIDTSSPREERAALSFRLLLLMAVAAGIAVANIYYNQPLLADMARSFGVSAEGIGWVAMLTQSGFAAGMLFLAPLGDAVDRRRMVVLVCIFAAVALLAVALSPNVAVISVASFAVGLGSIIPQLLVPFAVYLSRPEEQGRAVGGVMTGLLIGILLARTFSGYVGQHLGWRMMFVIACALMLIVAGVLRVALPQTERRPHLSYGKLMLSLVKLFTTEPVVRESVIVGATMFAAFSVFWSTLAFRLETPPYHYGSEAAGLFGLVGVAGASAASIAGRWADRRPPRQLLRILASLGVVSFVCFWIFGNSLWGLIAGVLLLDAGVQGGSTCNQTRNYRAVTGAHNRVNTVYMCLFFVGGSIGTSIGTRAWEHFGYTGVCAAGTLLAVLACVKVLLPARQES